MNFIDKDQTLIDIVMLVHDRADWADLAIRAVETHTKNRYRLIIVDMASQEQVTKDLFEEVKKRGHTVLHLSENRSFSAGVNAGVAVGSSKFICVLNDDALVSDGWCTAMLLDCTERTTGIAGARSNFAAGAQGDPSFIGDPPFLVFVCVMLRREVWDKLGPMDAENFDGFSGEDLDYSFRALKAGYKLKVSNAFVLHAGSQTLVKTQGDVNARAKNDQKYMLKLLEKWGKDWVDSHTKLRQSVLVVSYHAEEWTRVKFMESLQFLKRSDGVGYTFQAVTRAPIHVARQAAADAALDRGFDWLVQLDDDATFPSDVIRRLLSHNKDVVTALAYQRKPPHWACIFEVGEDGLTGKACEGWENTGLRKVDISGFHCSVIRTSVFKRLREGTKDAEGKVIVPGTKAFYGGFENKVGEDFAFSTNLRKLGIPIYCDTNLISGHIGEAIVVDEGYKKSYVQSQAGRQ
jgi:GT2 family glycosyltransferase